MTFEEKELEEKIVSLQGQVNYVNEALSYNLAPWERKEYEGVLKTYIEKAKDYQETLEVLRDVYYSNLPNSIKIINNILAKN